MGDLAEALFAKADAHAGLEALIGAPPRLEPQLAQQKVTTPYAVYTFISNVPSHVMRSDKVAWARVQVDCFGTSPEQARDVAAQVVACFDRWAGTFASVAILGSIIDERGRDTGYDDTTTLYGVLVEMRVMYGLS